MVEPREGGESGGPDSPALAPPSPSPNIHKIGGFSKVIETALELKQYYRRGVAYNFHLVSTDFHRIFPFIWNTTSDHGLVQNLSLNRKECSHLLRDLPFRKLAGSLFSAVGSLF